MTRIRRPLCSPRLLLSLDRGNQITNMPASMQSQLPRMQFGLTGGHPQRNLQSQMLNDQNDVYSAIEFDKYGDHLAAGDKGGIVVLFERRDARNHGYRKDLENQEYPISRQSMYLEKAKFYSHEFEVDFTTNMDIPEGIKKIKWCQTANHTLFLLSTNDKTIKHWKVQEKKVKKVSQMNVNALNDVQNDCVASTSMHNPGGCSGRPYNYLCSPPGGFPSLCLPVVETGQRAVPMVTCRRVYANAHSFGINSISNNSDGETFISADEIRINLWNFEINNQTFNIVLVKPENILNVFGMGGSNPASMVANLQQQQGGYGNIPTNTQNLQPGMVNLPNATQNPNFPQQRQQNQQ